MPMGVLGHHDRISADMRTAEYYYQLCISAELVIQPSINKSINKLTNTNIFIYKLRYLNFADTNISVWSAGYRSNLSGHYICLAALLQRIRTAHSRHSDPYSQQLERPLIPSVELRII